MSGSFVGQVPRRRGWYRIGIGLAGVCLGAFPVLGVTGQGSGAAILPLAENCNPPTITSAGSVTATAGASFNFTVTTCTTAIPTFKSVHLPSGLTLMSNGDGTATISGKPGVHDTGIYNATITAEVAGQTSAVQTLAVSVDNTPAFTTKAHLSRRRRNRIHRSHCHPVRLPDPFDRHRLDSSVRCRAHRQSRRNRHAWRKPGPRYWWHIPVYDHGQHRSVV